MGYKEIINSPGLWIVSSFIVIISVSQAIVFMKSAIREADELGIDKEKRKSAIRSATFTAIGPSLAPVITLLTMVAIVGAPTTWMRLCDVGAARSEIGVLSITSSLTGAEIGTSSFGLEAFSNGLWGMALNNFGWLFVVFILGQTFFGDVPEYQVVMLGRKSSLLNGEFLLFHGDLPLFCCLSERYEPGVG